MKVFIWTKKRKNFFELEQKYKNIFISFLVQMKTFKSTFEIYWPLIIKFYTNKAHHYIDTHSKILVAPN